MHREEKHCRFCSQQLPDWRPVLTPASLSETAKSPVLSIYYNGHCSRLRFTPGPEGLQIFLGHLRAVVGDLAHLSFAFRCCCPDTGVCLGRSCLCGIEWSGEG